jgi:hypothetical protein
VLEVRALAREILGVSNFSPLEGERANRWCDGSLKADGVEILVTELVEALRSPVNEMESRALLRCRMLPEEEVVVDVCRGTRDVEVDGELRKDVCLTLPTAFGIDGSSFSMTPNSFVDKEGGEGLGDGIVGTLALISIWHVPMTDPELFGEGDAAIEVLLDMRGILVGVSFGCPVTELTSGEEISFNSLRGCELFVPFM